MIICHLQGGLGNQLFQIFAVIAYSFRYKVKFILSDKLRCKRSTYWDSLFKELVPFTCDFSSINWSDYSNYNEPVFNHNEIPYTENVNVFGYFQSYIYFEEFYFDIINIIKLPDIIEHTRTKYLPYFEKDTISIHFRIGDYKPLPSHHPILQYNYYERSLEHILNSTNKDIYDVLYFYETSDIYDVNLIINKLQNKFTNLNFINIYSNNSEINDWEQMLLMTQCNHNVIANSTFSWWGAYIGYKMNESKIVCYPSTWFGPALTDHYTHDLFLEKWVCINTND